MEASSLLDQLLDYEEENLESGAATAAKATPGFTHEEEGYKCSVPACKKATFSSFYALRRHWLGVHTPAVVYYMCPVQPKLCPKIRRQHDVYRHVQKQHGVTSTVAVGMTDPVNMESVKSANSRYLSPGQLAGPLDVTDSGAKVWKAVKRTVAAKEEKTVAVEKVTEKTVAAETEGKVKEDLTVEFVNTQTLEPFNSKAVEKLEVVQKKSASEVADLLQDACNQVKNWTQERNRLMGIMKVQELGEQERKLRRLQKLLDEERRERRRTEEEINLLKKKDNDERSFVEVMLGLEE